VVRLAEFEGGFDGELFCIAIEEQLFESSQGV